MAGDWIKVEKATPRKPEILRIAAALEIHPDHAFGLCFRFWSWCDDHLDSTNARGVSSALVDSIVERKGFATAMIDVDWLRVNDGSLEIPNMDRHLSQTAKKRAVTAQRVAKHAAKTNARGVSASVSGALPIEEKRTEENILNTHSHPSVQVDLLGESVSKRLQRPPMPESFPNECAAIHGIEIDGDVVMYSEDPLRWEAAFISWWNTLSGVSKRSTMSLDTSQRRKLRDRLSEGDWFWKRTQAAFPLWTPTTWNPTIGKFLDPDTVTDILDGKYREQKRRATTSETNEPVMFTEKDLEDA